MGKKTDLSAFRELYPVVWVECRPSAGDEEDHQREKAGLKIRLMKKLLGINLKK